MSSGAALESIRASAFTVATDGPESDGTLEWDSTTMVLVEATAGGRTGIGYTYSHASAAAVINSVLGAAATGLDALRVGAAGQAMRAAARNLGTTGLVAAALSAVDCALWDLKGRLLGLAVVDLLDAARPSVPVYGSGGFCTYTDAQLADQLAGWVEQGIGRVKMKVGREPELDEHRARVARAAIGPEAELYVDANGALNRAQAADWAQRFEQTGVRWFEEPVSSDDLVGLRHVRERVPPGMDVAAGEYGWDVPYFARMLDAEAVSCLQVDVTRCGGFSGFLAAAALCASRGVDVSAHCAPQLSVHGCAAAPRLRHLELFHDHDRVEQMVFDGCLRPVGGALEPDRSRPGAGLDVRWADIERWRVG